MVFLNSSMPNLRHVNYIAFVQKEILLVLKVELNCTGTLSKFLIEGIGKRRNANIANAFCYFADT